MVSEFQHNPNDPKKEPGYLDRLAKALDRCGSDLSYKAPEMNNDADLFEALKQRYVEYIKQA
jgi:hypothetical protein